MAYHEDLAERIRSIMASERNVSEKKMFGGLAFLINGNMAISASGQGGLLLRADPADSEKHCAHTGVEMAVMRGRPMEGWLRVEAEQVRTKKQLEQWVSVGVAYARTLPSK